MRLELFVSSLKSIARLKNFIYLFFIFCIRAGLGLGWAWSPKYELGLARSENLNMSQAPARLELKKLGSVLPETTPFPSFWSLHFSSIVSTGLHCTKWSLQALVTLSAKLAEIWWNPRKSLALSLPYKEEGASGGRGTVRPETLHLDTGITYRTGPYCTALHCTELLCTALFFTLLYWTVLHCTALHCTTALGGFKASSQLSVLWGLRRWGRWAGKTEYEVQ